MTNFAELVIAGVMSGTSADGIDVALVRVKADAGGDLSSRIDGMRAEVLAHMSCPYAADVRKEILSIRGGEPFRWTTLAHVGRRLTLAHADAVNACLVAANRSAAQLDAIADHGQTFFHSPPDTIQWLDPALLSTAVGAAVIHDFRRADCAAGGQGAPLVPFADYVLFRQSTRTRILLNIGGIANFTYLRSGGTLNDVVAFDTGPGNCVSDALIARALPGAAGYDEGGALAAQGQPIDGLVDRLMRHPYFSQRPPKSTDRPQMLALFDEVVNELAPTATLPTKLHAACELTARSIVGAMKTFLDGLIDEVFASGGGVKNATLMRMLESQLPGITIRRTDELGILSGAKEAVAFAILGAATLWGIPANVPSATGARRPVILGSITPRPSPSSM